MTILEVQSKLPTVEEVASVLHVRLPRAYALVLSGVIPGSVPIGRQVRVDRGKLEEFIELGGKPLPTQSLTQ